MRTDWVAQKVRTRYEPNQDRLGKVVRRYACGWNHVQSSHCAECGGLGTVPLGWSSQWPHPSYLWYHPPWHHSHLSESTKVYQSAITDKWQGQRHQVGNVDNLFLRGSHEPSLESWNHVQKCMEHSILLPLSVHDIYKEFLLSNSRLT